VPDNPFRCAANYGMAKTLAAMGSHNDQVGIHILACFKNLLVGIPNHGMCGRSQLHWHVLAEILQFCDCLKLYSFLQNLERFEWNHDTLMLLQLVDDMEDMPVGSG
jgi:hypothetical protein